MIPTESQDLGHFVILGGGTSGWMAACMLGSIFQDSPVNITLIESADIPTIGVGEATIPPFLQFLQSVGISQREFVQATSSTFKLGIRFEDWLEKEQHYFHPFGGIGRDLDGHDFYQIWQKLCREGHGSELMAHSPAAVMAGASKFIPPEQMPNSPIASAAYALHLDAKLAAEFMRTSAIKFGVQRIEATVTGVEQHECGNIARLLLDNNQIVAGDFFIDCSGFRGVLIEETLATGYDSWAKWLPCDRAVTVQTRSGEKAQPYTVSTAQDAGWTWKIPLQHRVGNGYVYASAFCDDDRATRTLMARVNGDTLNTPRVIPFQTGVRKQIWNRNCLALGLAAGFVEPLESTAIHLVFKTLALFLQHFPDKQLDPILQRRFETRIRREYEEVRDFIVLHYCTTRRDDTAFWAHCRNMAIPDSLQEQLEYFRRTGQLLLESESLFRAESWYSVLTGMGVNPATYSPLTNALDTDKLAASLSSGAKAIAQCVTTLPDHEAFVQQACPSVARRSASQ